MMKKPVYLLLGLIILFFAQACRDKHGKNYNVNIDENGVIFIRNGIEGGLAEIKASGVAITKSGNQRVVNFAKMMVDDHTKAGDELKKIESDKEVIEKDTISSAHQETLYTLTVKSGKAFDKAYMDMMIADHQQAVKLFTDASHNKDTTINKFAARTLPTIQMHLDSANAIGGSLK